MLSPLKFVAAAVLAIPLAYFYDGAPSHAPEFTANAELKFPQHYREWVYLSSGLDMSYSPHADNSAHVFDNIFVNPESYQAFMKTGTWPDHTTFVLEVRSAENQDSIAKSGNYQGSKVLGYELHVKDEAHIPGKWGFYGFSDPSKPAKAIPASATCNGCHAQHAAVDTTFVQFYPTLMDTARGKRTLSLAYLKDLAQPRPVPEPVREVPSPKAHLPGCPKLTAMAAAEHKQSCRRRS